MADVAISGPGRRVFFRQGTMLKAVVLAILVALIVLPLMRTVLFTLHPDTIRAWSDVLVGRLSTNLFYKPLGNTLLIGAVVATGCVLLGGFLAWLVVMTNVPFRKTIGVMAALPFMIPSFAAALAWGTLFRNDRIGGQVGWLQGLGLEIPDWLAWGMVPTLIVLVLHYFSLAFTIIAAALATVNSDLVEAAQIAGAKGRRILLGIILPVTTPALVAAGSLCFAGAVSNFATPALLGLPVRMQTLSTRLFGMIEVGQVGRGYVIGILLVLVSGIFLWAGNRVVSGRRSYTTITGKGGRAKRFDLRGARWPLYAIAMAVLVSSTVVPVIVLTASSLAPSSANLFSGWTLHYWVGQSDPSFAQGIPGIAHNDDIVRALTITLGLGMAVAFTGMFVGLLASYTTARYRAGWMSAAITQISFLPLLVPGIAFGAAYIAYLGAPIGPFPALYGTFALLVIAATGYLLPFSVQTGRAVIQQVGGELEESARITGAGFFRRLVQITVPLAVRGLAAGGILIFVKIIRDLSLVVLLFTPTMPVLSVVAYRYASEGFGQFANAITVIIMFISIAATLIANRLQSKSQPWLQN
ncbi:iron ABC transporter permease [Aliiroseovarius sp. Z3]|uniref:ABC transporter permease n=1 Tax=Aliiroseovarius sp. Z3 TaxID=2811402 RepID=UPI0023B24B6C|nr:iron ABC transporter permease [Aliiroseovarius sp. Z3]MDE9451885.1 iron ABC transporter permease [Aliiroseovarius sp. Z3]MDE9452043.1 iron ABC transporter permease [Aliiroseovarius sp. Z3]